MTDHTVKAFDKDLAELGARIAEMGGLTEKMLTDAIDALLRLDLDLARATIATDPRVDALEREVEERAVLTLARRQPMGIDLREIVAAMRIASDLERVGDLAKNIAKRTLILQQEQRMPRALMGLRHMGQLAALQLKDVLDAYAQRDLERAKGVWNRDAEIDALDDSIFRELLTFMMEDPRNISPCTHLLFCSKNVERVGDHTTNIAETVHYIVTGASLPVERPKG